LGAPTTTFVSPSVARSTPTSTDLAFARSQAAPSGYGLYPKTTLHAQKNAPPSASKKFQVKLLRDVANIGQAGDVIQVAPAFFNNKLRPTKLAVIISDEQVAKDKAGAQADAQEIKAKATELKEKIDAMTLCLSRKVGIDGQLFGGIGAKGIMAEMQSQIGDDFFSRKSVKITEIMDGNGKELKGDIKHTGKYEARIVLLKDISAKLSIDVGETCGV
jgi:large subunit ribosomal protein L9